MLNISDEYKNAIVSPMREFVTKVIINDQEIDSKYLKGIKIEEISCSGEMVSIGDVCSNAFELEMFIPEEIISFEQAKVVIKSGLKLGDKIEWIDLGTYIVNEVVREEYLIKLNGYDAMKRFDDIYEPEIVFNDETVFTEVLYDLLRQCNVKLAKIDLGDYRYIVIDHYYENISCKELLGYLAGLMGCNARINRFNELEFYWYKDTNLMINEGLIYQGSYQETLESEFIINSLTSGDEEHTYTCGSGKGISFANPYMTQELLDKIFLKIEGFSYQPCTFKWRGNPSIENSDVIRYIDKNIVVTKQTLMLDGGFSSEIECVGKLENDVVMNTSSPTEIKLNKLYNTLTNAFKHSSETILGMHGGNLIINVNDDGKPSGWTIMNTPTLEPYTKLWKFTSGGLGYSENGGKTFKNIAFDMNGNFNANAITTGSLEGEMFELDLRSGVIKIGKRDSRGNISKPSFYLNEQGELKITAFEEYKNNNNIFISDIEPENPIDDMKWLDTSNHPNILKVYDQNNWIPVSDYTGTINFMKGEISSLNTSLDLELGRIDALVKDLTIEVDGEEVSLKETVENMVLGLDGLTNTLKITGGNNLIRDSIGCFNDGSWEGDYNIDSTPETRSRNMYGYALLLKNGSLKQGIQITNGTYTLSFIYKKLINLANVKVTVNGEEISLSNSDYTEFKHTFTVTTNSVEIEFVSDTDNSCPIINLMLNKGDEKMEWTLNPNETWSDTVQIGRGIRISSSGTDVVFVANADIIGFMNKQGEYIATFDDEGLVANAAVIKNKATIVNLLIQDINDQTVINRINSNEVEVIDNGN
ncbi:hypothetical protein [Thomasclavelia cocleata]|uniref:hypothetical protein n=1 Tax=Thomasclavelia cocleata TaxID=69824 RepID=UPI00242A935E|nr:hypothetical protein [Thomasclavelia cocleata]